MLFTVYYSVTLQTKETIYKLFDNLYNLTRSWMESFFTIVSTSIIMSCSQLCSVINYYHSKSWQILTNRAMSHNKNMLVKKKVCYSLGKIQWCSRINEIFVNKYELNQMLWFNCRQELSPCSILFAPRPAGPGRELEE